MQSLYDRTDIYDLLENPKRSEIVKQHWQKVFSGKQISSLLDVSIGTGNLTLPLAELGIQLSGSDLSEKMLERCRQKASDKDISIDLSLSDFRKIAETRAGQRFDCVASTGNSLAYVSNDDVTATLAQMDKLVKPNGYLFFDTRNWDMILRERPRFYLYDPVYDNDTRINIIQVWDYNTDDTVTFNLLYTFEKDDHIIKTEQFEEHYIPVSRKLLTDTLSSLGYSNIEIMGHPSIMDVKDMEQVPWYCVIAQKSGSV